MVLVLASPNDHAKDANPVDVLVNVVAAGKHSLVALKFGVERILNTTTLVMESLNPPDKDILNLTL